PMPLLILKHPPVLATADAAPIFLGSPPAGFSRVPPLHVALSASIHEAVQGREHLLGHPATEVGAPAPDQRVHLINQVNTPLPSHKQGTMLPYMVLRVVGARDSLRPL